MAQRANKNSLSDVLLINRKRQKTPVSPSLLGIYSRNTVNQKGAQDMPVMALELNQVLPVIYERDQSPRISTLSVLKMGRILIKPKNPSVTLSEVLNPGFSQLKWRK